MINSYATAANISTADITWAGLRDTMAKMEATKRILEASEERAMQELRCPVCRRQPKKVKYGLWEICPGLFDLLRRRYPDEPPKPWEPQPTFKWPPFSVCGIKLDVNLPCGAAAGAVSS